jgi:hypothetical protein
VPDNNFFHVIGELEVAGLNLLGLESFPLLDAGIVDFHSRHSHLVKVLDTFCLKSASRLDVSIKGILMPQGVQNKDLKL